MTGKHHRVDRNSILLITRSVLKRDLANILYKSIKKNIYKADLQLQDAPD